MLRRACANIYKFLLLCEPLVLKIGALISICGRQTPRDTPHCQSPTQKTSTRRPLKFWHVAATDPHMETTFQNLYGSQISEEVRFLRICQELETNLTGMNCWTRGSPYIDWDPLESDMDTTISHLYGSQTQLTYTKLWKCGRYLTYSVNYVRCDLTGCLIRGIPTLATTQLESHVETTWQTHQVRSVWSDRGLTLDETLLNPTWTLPSTSTVHTQLVFHETMEGRFWDFAKNLRRKLTGKVRLKQESYIDRDPLKFHVETMKLWKEDKNHRERKTCWLTGRPHSLRPTQIPRGHLTQLIRWRNTECRLFKISRRICATITHQERNCWIRSRRLTIRYNLRTNSPNLCSVWKDLSPPRRPRATSCCSSISSNLRWWLGSTSDLVSASTKESEMLRSVLTRSALAPEIASLPGHPPTSLIPWRHVSWSVMAALMKVCTSTPVLPGAWRFISATRYMDVLSWSSESANTSRHWFNASLPKFAFSMLLVRV